MSRRPPSTAEWLVQRGKTVLGRVVISYDDDTFAIVADARDAPGTPDVTLTLTPGDAAAVGTLRPSVAFMRGQMKMRGDFGALLHVLPVSERAEHREALAAALAADG